MNASSIQEQIRITEAELAALKAERAQVVDAARVTAAQADAILARTDKAVSDGLDDGTSSARRIRDERQDAHAVKSRAQAAVTAWDRDNASICRRMQERINDLRKSLPHAEHEEQAAPQLERAIATARTRLVDAIGSRDDAGQNLAQVEQRLSEAHGLVDAEIDRVHGLAELNAKRESLRADAFVKGHPVDRDRMARLDAKVSEVESQIEAAREHAEGARAAISTLEGLADRAAATLERAKQQVHEAEQGGYAAVRAQAVRQFNTQVHAMRDTLLTLEAVDGELGVNLCAALHDRGLHSVTIDGQLAKPDWLHSITQRPDSYRAAVAAEKARILQGENAEI
tara:strand:+ start:56405 stop:57427 length:1023 start_codon:yes stop_codon:yes gene_type:complete